MQNRLCEFPVITFVCQHMNMKLLQLFSRNWKSKVLRIWESHKKWKGNLLLTKGKVSTDFWPLIGKRFWFLLLYYPFFGVKYITILIILISGLVIIHPSIFNNNSIARLIFPSTFTDLPCVCAMSSNWMDRKVSWFDILIMIYIGIWF